MNFDYDVYDIISEQKEADMRQELTRCTPEACKGCVELRAGFRDNTIAFDVEKRLRVTNDIEIIAICAELQGEPCNPDACSHRKLDLRAYDLESIKSNLEVVKRLFSEVKGDVFGEIETGKSNLNCVIKQIDRYLKTA